MIRIAAAAAITRQRHAARRHTVNYGADAAIDVELEVAEAIEAFGVLLAHGRQNEGAEEGQADLATVGVAGEHDVDEGAAGVGENVIGVVWLVRHEDAWTVGFGGDGEAGVGTAGAGVVV